MYTIKHLSELGMYIQNVHINRHRVSAAGGISAQTVTNTHHTVVLYTSQYHNIIMYIHVHILLWATPPDTA